MMPIGKADAMSYALMLHMISYLPKILLGLIFMTNLNITLKKTEAELNKFKHIDMGSTKDIPEK